MKCNWTVSNMYYLSYYFMYFLQILQQLFFLYNYLLFILSSTSIYLRTIYLSILSIYLYPSIKLSIHLSIIHPLIYIYLSKNHLSIQEPSIYLFFLYIYLPIYQTFYIPIYNSSFHLHLFIYEPSIYSRTVYLFILSYLSTHLLNFLYT